MDKQNTNINNRMSSSLWWNVSSIQTNVCCWNILLLEWCNSVEYILGALSGILLTQQ